MGNDKKPPTDYPGADRKPSMTVLPDRLPDDFDPFAVLANAPTVALIDTTPHLRSNTQVIAPTPALPPVEDVLPDMTDPRVRALYVNQGTAPAVPRDDADPLDLEVLALLERVHHGGLLNPFASDVRQKLRDLIPLLRNRVCQTPTTDG